MKRSLSGSKSFSSATKIEKLRKGRQINNLTREGTMFMASQAGTQAEPQLSREHGLKDAEALKIP